MGSGGGVKTTFSFEYSYSWTVETTKTKTETITFEQEVQIAVPKGKVYQVKMFCNNDQLTVPYHALIYVSGQTEAWFASPINGQKHWQVDAGTLCSWINQYGSAGAESYKYGRNPNKPSQGIIALQGTLTATQTTNFIAKVFDMTESYKVTESTQNAPLVNTIALSQ